jgi:hypothetical protein
MAVRPEIPKDHIEKYVGECVANFRDLTRELKREMTRSSDVLKEMKKGDNFLPSGSPPDSDVVRLINTRSKKTRYYFRTQSVKDREVSRMQTRVKDLESVGKTPIDPNDKEALFSLLTKYGPRLDARRQGSIGFMSDAVVLVAFDDNGVIVVYDDTPFLLWVESAAGLTTGSELTPMPIYVAGTETIQIPGRGSQVVTLLQTVTETELRNAVYGGAQAIAGEWRVWKDNTGKFEVEASLVEVVNEEVVLKKRDGQTIKVPLSRLSDADRQSLGK